MSKNFKAEIRERYTGRGNCWVKVPHNSDVYTKMVEAVPSADHSESFFKHVDREGFGWIRFSKPCGSEDAQYCLFEVRYRGAKLDHPDCVLKLENETAKALPLLGNTPVKLQLEVDPLERKEKKESSPVKRSKKLTRKSNSIADAGVKDDLNSMRSLEIISEKKLSNASSLELKKWEEFLTAEDLIDFAIEC